MAPGWGRCCPPWGYLGFAEPIHLGFPAPAGERALPGGVFLLFPQVQALRRDGGTGREGVSLCASHLLPWQSWS